MSRVPRILPLVAVAIGGVLAVKALADADALPKVMSGARAFAEEAQSKSAKPAAKAVRSAPRGETKPEETTDGETATSANAASSGTAMDHARGAGLGVEVMEEPLRHHRAARAVGSQGHEPGTRFHVSDDRDREAQCRRGGRGDQRFCRSSGQREDEFEILAVSQRLLERRPAIG